jgi:hypothetical protein
MGRGISSAAFSSSIFEGASVSALEASVGVFAAIGETTADSTGLRTAAAGAGAGCNLIVACGSGLAAGWGTPSGFTEETGASGASELGGNEVPAEGIAGLGIDGIPGDDETPRDPGAIGAKGIDPIGFSTPGAGGAETAIGFGGSLSGGSLLSSSELEGSGGTLLSVEESLTVVVFVRESWSLGCSCKESYWNQLLK